MTFVHLNYANTTPTSLSVDVSPDVDVLPVLPYTWPSTYPFTVTIDRGNQSQEVCLVTDGTTASLTVVRNYDGAIPNVLPGYGYSHLVSAVVEMSATATDFQDFNLHATVTTRDDHPSLMQTDGGRHSLVARHQMGSSLPPGPPLAFPPFGGTWSQPDAASALSHADHVHERSDSWATWLGYMLNPGMVVPVTDAFSDPRFIICDGAWYNQADWPVLWRQIGQQYTGTHAGTGSSSPFQASIHFSVPLVGNYASGVYTGYLGTPWAIMAALA